MLYGYHTRMKFLETDKDDDKNGYVDDIHGWNFLGDIVEENMEYTFDILKNLRTKI